jgi:GT2 family glycosyltransferase
VRIRLAIVIINYRTAGLVADCLATLNGQVQPGRDEVVIVDNASGDDSPNQIENHIRLQGWGGWVRLVRSSVNGGFSAGNNVGIRAVDADAYLLLNSDTLVRPGAIAAMLDAMRQRPDAGLISPRLLMSDGSLHLNCYRFATPISEMLMAAKTGCLSNLFSRYQVVLPVTDEPSEPQWTSFACVLVRREAIDRIGLMDEGYFMYYEDQDYCRLAGDAGWKTLNWPKAVVVHLQGQSSPVRSLTAAMRRRPRYFYAARSRYFAKHYTWVGLWLANLLWAFGRVLSLGRELLGLKKPHLCEYQFRDNWTNGCCPLTAPARPVGS